MTTTIAEKLEKFGLSAKEAKVYVTVLELGTSVVSDIATKAKINRSTAYIILESLAKRSLITVSESKKVRLYTAFSPEHMVEFAKGLARKYSELVVLGEQLVPELKSLYKESKPKPKARFLEGPDGLIEAYEDALTAKETVKVFASNEDMDAVLPDYFPEYNKRKSDQKIETKIIKNTKESQSFTPEINVYDNKSVFISPLEKFALILESKEVADALKKIFELSFSSSKSSKEK